MADELPISNESPGSADGGVEFDPLDHQSDTDESTQSPDAQTSTDEAAGPTLPQELSDALRRERLPAVANETPEAAYARLTFHLTRKSEEYGRKMAKARDEHTRQLEDLRVGLEPMLRDYYQRQRYAQLEEQAAQIPPKDSPEYQVWLAEEVLRRDDERRQQEEQAALTRQQQQEEMAIRQQVAAIDQAGYAKVAEGLGLVQGVEPDIEFSQAYDLFSNYALIAARDIFPGSPDESIEAFIALSQQQDIRRAEEAGIDFRDVMKRRLNAQIDKLEELGLVQRVPRSGGQGNGNRNQQPQAQQSQQQPSTQRTVSQQVKAGAAAAAKRGPSAVPSSNRPTQLSGQIPDPNKFDSDDDYVEAALAGLLGGEEQRTGMHRRNR